MPVLGVHRDDMRVDGSHEQRVAQNREAAIHASAAQARLRRRTIRVDPKNAAGGGVQRHDIVGRLHRVHHAIHHQRRSFEFFERARLKNPFLLQVLDVAGRDLVERAVALAEIASRVIEPVLRSVGGVQQAVERNLGR